MERATLGLHGDGNFLRLERPGQLMVEFRQFFIRHGGVPLLKNVVNGQHGHRMSDLVEALEGGATYAARGGVRIRQFGVGFFQFFQLQEQGVIFRVGNLRFRLFVIQAACSRASPARDAVSFVACCEGCLPAAREKRSSSIGKMSGKNGYLLSLMTEQGVLECS